MKSPCKDCPDRHYLCHSTCEKYIAYDILRDIYRDKRHKQNRLEDDLFKTSRHNPDKKKRKHRPYRD